MTDATKKYKFYVILQTKKGTLLVYLYIRIKCKVLGFPVNIMDNNLPFLKQLNINTLLHLLPFDISVL